MNKICAEEIREIIKLFRVAHRGEYLNLALLRPTFVQRC